MGPASPETCELVLRMALEAGEFAVATSESSPFLKHVLLDLWLRLVAKLVLVAWPVLVVWLGAMV